MERKERQLGRKAARKSEAAMGSTAVVRYGAMDKTDRFSSPVEGIQVGNDVVVRTPRGVEWGRVVLVKGEDAPADSVAGEVLRRAASADYDKYLDIVERCELEELKSCRQLIKAHKLPMKLVRAEHLFGGSKIIFYFLAEGRVDFRQLVKDLATQYRTRIEMRQIGVRDEARLMGQIGPCGNELCCRTFLTTLKPVPMKLAKDQKSTLDPSKISGTCGRLKCCLKYEEELYKQLKKNLPRRGAKVRTAEGDGTVVDYDIISQTVNVEMPDGNRQKFPASDVTVQPEQ
jgi:cell fate regulator YaaT (PSP1 superfamily)